MLLKKWKIEKKYQQRFDEFFGFILFITTNKKGRAHIKKLVKTLMDFFQKFSILSENLVNSDVTYSVILGTVLWRIGMLLLTKAKGHN